jgi:hypothetical protein
VASSYPLEILGEPGTELRVALHLSEADRAVEGPTRLALTVHNVLAEGSAMLRVNDGPPIDLGATELVRPMGGLVASATIGIDRALLRTGENHIVFRHAERVVDVLPMSGFRVLALALEIGDRRIALDLPLADPKTFEPIRNDAASLARGRQLFQEISRDGGPTCSRCHTSSGADLAYYGLSNHALVERAMFHEFSLEEAEDIASYIRSLDVAPEGYAYGAPFQPGDGNHGAAGAGAEAALDDAGFMQAAFGAEGLPDDVAWDWAASLDTFELPAPLPLLTWHRFLPRTLDPSWFEAETAALAEAEQALADEGSFDAAEQFLAAAVTIGREIFTTGNNPSRIDLLRYAAVKLWDWSRQRGFDEAHHGFVDAPPRFAPPYLYEVGFAFFEAREGVPHSAEQTLMWWWAQLAVHPGRGLSDGLRPLNYRDVLAIAESAGAGPQALAFLHLLGSWEESRGALAGTFGTSEGPVRLLATPVRHLAAADRVAIYRRFFAREAEFLTAGGVLTGGHHAELAAAWQAGCDALSAEQKQELVDFAPAEIRPDLTACP